MRVAFFHGLESAPHSEKNVALDSTFDFVYAPPMDYTDAGLFDRVLKQVQNDEIDLLIGSSMGGYFAYCISTITGIPTLIFNPAVQGRSMEPKVKYGNKRAIHTVVLGRKDDVIDPNKSIEWFDKNGIGQFRYTWESNAHRIPINVFTKWITNMKPKMKLKYLHEMSSVKEEWSTESPGTGGEMASILPETVVQTLVPNFLTARPPVGNLTVEDAAEFILITAEQKCLTEEDYKFIKQSNDAPHEVFYQWLVLRGYRPSMAQLRGWWESEPNIKLISDLKNTYKRERPFVKFPEVHLAPGVSANDYSFPSGHACGSFYIATKLSEIYPHLADQLFGLADRIANTRVQAGVHYPSDVQAGRAIGIALAQKP
jgi:hypothetical protein